MKEIAGRPEVELLVDKFYEKVVKDDLIGFFFTDVVEIDWSKHKPVMYDFWESTLFGLAKYRGNPMLKHIELDKKEKLHPEHFNRWLDLWKETVSENFEGEMAEQAVQRAGQIGELMKYKVATHNTK